MGFVIKKNIYIRGFTLVELLVVISIIGLLSSFAMVSLNSARIKARDALRKGDMAQIRTAMNLYYDDNFSYPACGTWDGSSPDFGADLTNGPLCYLSVLEPALTAGSRPIMIKLPRDPRNPGNDPVVDSTHIYRYVSDGDQYAIVYTLEEGGEQVFRGW